MNVGTTDDLISRQAAIDAICSICGNDCDKSKFVYNAPQWEQVILCPEHYVLASLPSVQLEQKSGRWIKVSADRYVRTSEYIHRCSECGNNTVGKPKYCPDCGARMEIS